MGGAASPDLGARSRARVFMARARNEARPIYGPYGRTWGPLEGGFTRGLPEATPSTPRARPPRFISRARVGGSFFVVEVFYEDEVMGDYAQWDEGKRGLEGGGEVCSFAGERNL